ncbi:unnamed protein product [Lymnaea stagnalis]|uniref:Globin n=1 Tax=Lymnaea stagnalis TaxID=6523 RepID=A0AAV2H4U7_LYMST
MRKRFHKFPASSAASVLKVDKEFLRHSRKVIVELDEMVKVLNAPDVLKSRALKLARRHLDLDPPIGSQFFDPFYEKFHVFIETSLDLPPEHEEVQLWTSFLSFIIAVLKVEEAKHRTKPSDSDICCILL